MSLRPIQLYSLPCPTANTTYFRVLLQYHHTWGTKFCASYLLLCNKHPQILVPSFTHMPIASARIARRLSSIQSQGLLTWLLMKDSWTPWIRAPQSKYSKREKGKPTSFLRPEPEMCTTPLLQAFLKPSQIKGRDTFQWKKEQRFCVCVNVPHLSPLWQPKMPLPILIIPHR